MCNFFVITKMDAQEKILQKRNKFLPSWWKITVPCLALRIVLSRSKKTEKEPQEYFCPKIDCLVEVVEYQQLLYFVVIILWIWFWKVWILPLQPEHLQGYSSRILSVIVIILWADPSQSKESSLITWILQ